MKLWIDDMRPMPKDYDILAKTANQAISILSKRDITHVSFDHDLGGEKTGYDVAVWVEGEAYLGNIKPFTYTVHSANPVGAKKIKDAMLKAERYWNAN